MKTFTAFVLGLALFSLVAYAFWWNTLPEVQTVRATRLAIANNQAQALAPFQYAAKLALTTAGALAGCVVLLALARKALLWSHLAYPDRHAMYAEFAPSRLIREITPALNQPHAQVAAALADGNIQRWGGAGQVARALNRQDDVPLLAAPAPLPQLPSRSVFDVPAGPELNLAIGESERGQVAFDLANLDNIIIGGLRGKGKSNLLGAMMAWLLRKDATGKHIKLVLMDLKDLDFAIVPRDMAALWRPVATDPESALAAVRDMHAEMLRRRDVIRGAGYMDIGEYRAAGGDMPYLIGMCDELALMTTGATDASKASTDAFTSYAIEIGRIGRSMGVSLVLATQLCSSDNIPVVLRNNCGIQVAFSLPDANSSRTVIQMAGAEKLGNEPGVGLVRQGGEPVKFRAYNAEMKGGRFRTFLEQRPRLGGLEFQPTPTPTDGSGISAATTPTPTAFKLDRGRKPSAEQAEYIRRLYRSVPSKTAICKEIWNYKDGVVFGYVNDCLEGKL